MPCRKIMNLMLIIFILLSLIPIQIETVKADYIIDGDRVYIDDEYVYLSVEPHTIIEDSDVVFELISKQFSGDIDVAFGIDSELMTPKNPRIWDGESWSVLQKDIEVVYYDYQGFDKWFLLKNVNINQGQLYKLKLNIDIIFNSTGKYFFGVKRSQDTINQGYYIDPWWNSSWNNRIKISVSSSFVDESLSGFPLLVPISSTIGSDCNGGDSIRFLGLDNTTEYPYEIELWDSSSTSYVHVNLSYLSASGTSFWLYYNNSAASNGQTPIDVWDENYTAVYHMNDWATYINDSTSNYNNLTGYGDPVFNATGKVGTCVNPDNNDYFRKGSPFTTLDTLGTVESWVQTTDKTGSSIVFSASDKDNNNEYFCVDYWTTKNAFAFYGYPADARYYGETDITNNQWYHVAWVSNSTHFRLYVNDTNGMHNESLNRDSGSESFWFDDVVSEDTNSIWSIRRPTNIYSSPGYIDELRISNCVRNESWLNVSHHSQNMSNGFLVFGAMEYIDVGGPTGLLVNTTSQTSTHLNWTVNSTANYTHIMRNTGSYPTSRTDGTLIYNDTGTETTDSTLSAMTTYYYRAWGFNSSTGNWSVGTASTYNYTGPNNPTSVDANPVVNDVNISWVLGTNADTTAIIRKIESYPTSVSDGTLLYNGSGLYHVDSSVLQTYYYRLYSWDNTTDLHSTGINVPWGALDINCYDENNLTNITFDVFVTNEDGSQTYEATGCTNTHRIDVDDCPLGTGIGIHISATDSYNNQTETFLGYLVDQNTTTTYIQLHYEAESKITTNVTCWNSTGNTESYPEFILVGDVITIYPDHADEFDQINVSYRYELYGDRWYYMDLETNSQYILNTYLPPSSLKYLYVLSVVNELDDPVKNASMRIMQFIDGEYINITILYTNGYGQVTVFLIPNVHHKVAITKSGYETEYADYTPSSAILTHTFRLEYEEIEPTPPYVEPEEITFNGYIDSVVLYINYTDALEQTIDTNIYIYELNYTTFITSLLTSDSRTDDDNFQISTAINISNGYIAVLHYNHTTFGHQTKTLTFEATVTPLTTQTTSESLFALAYGTNPLGWTNTFMWFFLVAGFFSFGQRGAGIALILVGGITASINTYIGFNTTLSSLAGGVIPALLVIVGIMVLWKNSRKEALA